jgi:hypothetical protein
MTIGIIELAEAGHFTYVESIAQVYLSAPDNKVIILTTPKGAKALAHLDNPQLSVVEINPEIPTVFDEIGRYDLNMAYIVTLEHTNKQGYRLIQSLLATNWRFPVNFVIHNIVFWTKSGILEKVRSVLYHTKGLNSAFYELKKTFWYGRNNSHLLKHIFNSNGKLVVLSHAVASELATHVGAGRVQVMPFSVYTGAIPDNSADNKKIRVCFPGYVSAVRRDYFSVLRFFKHPVIRQHYTFDFLGGIAEHEGGAAVVIEAKHYQSMGADIYLYEKPSVGIVEFDEQLAKADLIFGNLHVQVGFNSTYGKSKESGLLFTMIKAAKPGMVPADYPVEPALITSNLTFNNYDEALQLLIKIAEQPTLLNALKEQALVGAREYAPESVLKKISVESPKANRH